MKPAQGNMPVKSVGNKNMSTKNLNKLPEFKISFKYKNKSKQTFFITSTLDAAEAARACFNADSIEWTESFIVIALTRMHDVIGFYKVSSGGITSTGADPKVILQFALLSNACNLILAHNHPSGSIKPSLADEIVTKKIKQAAEVHDIKILDHIIVTSRQAYSMEYKESYSIFLINSTT